MLSLGIIVARDILWKHFPSVLRDREQNISNTQHDQSLMPIASTYLWDLSSVICPAFCSQCFLFLNLYWDLFLFFFFLFFFLVFLFSLQPPTVLQTKFCSIYAKVGILKIISPQLKSLESGGHVSSGIRDKK